MKAPDTFEIVGKRAFFRPVGTVALHQAVSLVTDAIRYTRESGATELLANVSGLTGFASPRTLDRYALIEKWADAAEGRVRLAVVARPEVIDPNRFGVTVAANRGMEGNVFTTEAEAVEWLDSRSARAPA